MTNAEEPRTFAVFDHAHGREAARIIESAGAECIVFPPIEIDILGEDFAKISERIDSFDWIAFTDVFAAESLIEISQRMAFDLERLETLRVLACGEAVGDVLRFHGVHSDVIPLTDNPDVVFGAVDDYLCADWEGLRMLALTRASESGFNSLSRIESDCGAFSAIPVYNARFPDGFNFASRRTLLATGAIDVFVLASPGDATALRILQANARETHVAHANEGGQRSGLDAGFPTRPLGIYL